MTDALNLQQLAVPFELDEALDPAWLSRALGPLSGGRPVSRVDIVDRLETVAAKVRFTVRFGDDPTTRHFCLKAFLGRHMTKAGRTAVREAKFYTEIAPHIRTRTPNALSVIDEQEQRAVLIMDDLIDAGAHFCSALEPFTAEDAAATLDQIARLHAGSGLLLNNDWIPFRLPLLAEKPHFDANQLGELMKHPRFASLSATTAEAPTLLEGMKRLRDRFANSPLTILHGDCHAGNFYMTEDGPGLTDWQVIQRGHWAQDVAYHIAAVLPIEIAEREERALLDHYIDRLHASGGTLPDCGSAWDDYRAAQIYGYYNWAITTKVDPEVTDVFVQRLGAGMDRHRTHELLGTV